MSIINRIPDQIQETKLRDSFLQICCMGPLSRNAHEIGDGKLKLRNTDQDVAREPKPIWAGIGIAGVLMGTTCNYKPRAGSSSSTCYR